MKNYFKHIDDFFREKLGRYRETPPPDVWEALDKQLDGLIPSPTIPRPSFRWLGNLTVVIIAAAICVPLVKKMTAGNSPVGKSELVTVKPEAKNGAGTTVTVTSTDANSAATGAGKVPAEAPAQSMQRSTTDNGTAANTGAKNTNTAGGRKLAAEVRSAGTDNQRNNPKSIKDQGRNAGRRKHDARVADASGVAARENKTKGRGTTDPVAANNYTSNYGNNDAGVMPQEAQNASQTKQPATALKTAKKENVKKSVAKKEQVTPAAVPFNKFEAGLKAGYEQGLNSDAAGKYVLSPYLQYNLSPKLALMIQPAVKYAQLRTRNVGFSETYYKLNNDGKTIQDGDPVQVGVQGGTGVYTTKYTYSETHDLITKSYTTGGKYMEMELPILLKYKIAKQLSMYVGVNAVYQRFGVTEHTSTQHGLVSSTDFNEVTVGMPTTLPIGGELSYAGNPFSDYKGPAYQSPRDQVNIGYMFGLSYECCSRWLLDALLEQTPTRLNMADGYNINSPLSAPQIRLSAGYRFIK